MSYPNTNFLRTPLAEKAEDEWRICVKTKRGADAFRSLARSIVSQLANSEQNRIKRPCILCPRHVVASLLVV